MKDKKNKYIPDMKETGLCFYASDKFLSFHTGEVKRIKHLEKLATNYPDYVTITHRNDDGSINAIVPVKYFKLQPLRSHHKDYVKKEYTEEQKIKQQEIIQKALAARAKKKKEK